MKRTKIHKTWNDFWGPLLMVRFHEDNPQRWEVRQSRARWLFSNLALSKGARVLDLGCGDGLLDICLARLGATVTGVDRLSSVLNLARKEAGAAAAEFVEADLRSFRAPKASYDLILLLDVVGLMSKTDDARLISNTHSWLRTGGRLLVDCPNEPAEQTKSWTREFPDGVLQVTDLYDHESRTQHIDVQFSATDGRVLDLWDPYDASRQQHAGVIRYLYPPEELRSMLRRAGFRVRDLAHYAGDKFYLLEGTAESS